MDAIAPLLILVAGVALIIIFLRSDFLRSDIQRLESHVDRIEKQISDRGDRTDERFDNFSWDVRQRLDEMNSELAELRRRLAKQEGFLEDVRAGRRDRNAAWGN